MKLNSLIAASAIALASFGASADTITSGPSVGASFSDLSIGTIHISSLSDLTGFFYAADHVGFPAFSLSLQAVTFSSGTVGALTDLDVSASGFNFHNVAAGDYLVKASGNLTGPAQMPGVAFISADYTVTAVPEPETYAMLLAGLGVMGAIARRRNNKAA